ncbi:hypothetical protein ACWD4B_30220 [Streptomyces sp. NPDC002536]
MATAAAVTMAITVSGSELQPLRGNSPVAAADDPGGFDLKNAAQVREDQCRLGYVLRKGGANMKAVARAGLAGTGAELHAAANPNYWEGTPLADAFRKDRDWSDAKMNELWARNPVWQSVLDGVAQDQWTPGYSTWPPGYPGDKNGNIFQQTGLLSWMFDRFWTDEAGFYVSLPPTASKESVDAVTKIATTRYSKDRIEDYADWKAWESDMQFMHPMYADDARIFLQNGGFPTSVPDPSSTEFRIDVENLKARFASCASHNPPDPHNVLGAELTTASVEWQAELDSQKTQRDAILRAEVQANADLTVAAQALGEALGQSMIASRLTHWLAYWLHPDPEKPWSVTQADIETVKTRIAQTRARATGRLYVAARAALDAQTQADKVAAVQQDAYAIADKAKLPRGRGLMYAQQAAQITKASAAAAQAAAKATETASNATRASAEDSKTLDALAMTQAHATKAEFRRIAAQEAAAQAKAAAEGAAAEAVKAAENASKAKAAQAKAEAAEKVAKSAAEDAASKRATAEAERKNAADARARADAERTKAAEAESRAQTQRSVADEARKVSQKAGETALSKRNDAEQAEEKASQSRDSAVAAEREKQDKVARAKALEAVAAAAEGTADAASTRAAASEARQAADAATTAATSARAAADEASAAAVNAVAAATEAEGASARSQAAADGAARDAAVTSAQVKKAHAAAAEAIEASEAAAQNVRNAEAFAKEAAAKAVKAHQDAEASRSEADAASVDAVRTAGFAYATAQAALAARDSATQVAKPANDAIELGSPYKETDSSAGLAVLTGQAAKTAAQQQEAVAKAKSDQAAKAAAEAADLAQRADADAKAAATAAADAAGWAVKAGVSLDQARASAADAAAAARAAKSAETNTVEYDRAANADALAARVAADQAKDEASAARAAATDAERDAASARGAATAAENDATKARSNADRAERNAVEAEKSAANAREDAKDADQAATRAEEALQEELEAQRAAVAARTADGSGSTGDGGPVLSPDDEGTLRAACGQKCVDEYRAAQAAANRDVIDWVKANGASVLLEVIGVNDARRCFSSGNVEGCLWTVVNAVSVVVIVGKIPAISKAIVTVARGVAGFFHEVKIAERTLERLRLVIRSKAAEGIHFNLTYTKVVGSGKDMVRLAEAGKYTFQFKTGHGFYRAHTGPGGIVTDLRETNLNADQVEQEIANDALSFMEGGGKLPGPGNGHATREVRVGGYEVGYHAIQTPDDVVRISTYYLTPNN